MTDAEMRIAIAQHRGWTHIESSITGVFGRAPGATVESPLPNYTRDLNAMHEAEKTLPGMDDNHWQSYIATLLGLLYEPLEPHLRTRWHDNEQFMHWLLATATARQRAEAFLRTVGRYREDA